MGPGSGDSAFGAAALGLARDGTVGYWDGSADRHPRAARDGWTVLRTMGAGPRRAVIDQTLAALFAVTLGHSTGANDSGAVTCQGKTLVTLVKPSDAFLAEHQLAHLRAAADLRADRLSEIILQTGDIQSFLGLPGYLAPDATKWSLALSQALFRLCNAIEHPLKHGFDVIRPVGLSSKVQPLIQTPGHGAWPSGHATEAFACATLLTRLFGGPTFDPVAAIAAGSPIYRHAARIAANRTVAGVHFPTDSMAGAILGVTLAEALVRLLDGETALPARRFDGSAYTGDFTLALLAEALQDPATVAPGTIAVAADTMPDWMLRLWDEACAEH